MLIGLIPVVVELIRQAEHIFKGARRGAERLAWVKENAQVGRVINEAFLDELIGHIHGNAKKNKGMKPADSEDSSTLCCSACGGINLIPQSKRPPMINLTAAFAKPKMVIVAPKNPKKKKA